MPVPAADTIASDIGHGALGVRTSLRPFRDLLSETAGQRHLWVELRPKYLIPAASSWTEYNPVDPKTYYTGLASGSHTFDGVPLDVVGVQTPAEALSRVESIALCEAAAGRYYWDQTSLYVHLTGATDPDDTSVVVEWGVHVGSHGVYQPVFYTDRLTNGAVETWSGSTLTGWTTGVGSGVGLDKTTSDPLQGSYAARFTFTSASGVNGYMHQDFTNLVAGSTYRVSGAYRNICSANGLYAILYVYDGSSAYLTGNGRDISTATAIVIDTTGDGVWRRFSYDFVCPSWATVRVQLVAQVVSGTQSGTVDFDDLKMQCISRYTFSEPLLSMDSLPTIEAARADSFWGQMSSAIGSLSLLNGNGYLEPLLASYDFLGADAIFRVGGKYQLGGNEIGIEDCPIIATAKLGALSVSDSRVTFDLTDDRKLLLRTLPTRTYNNNSGTDAYQQADRGRVRPLLFGDKHGIRPVQYDIAYYSSGPVPLGVYELVDCTDWSDGLVEVTSLYWYRSDNDAAARSTAFRTSILGSGEGITDYSESVTFSRSTGRFTVLRDLRPLVITNENNKLWFDIGGSTLVAEVASGTYCLFDSLTVSGDYGFLVELAEAMNSAASVSDITCTFTDSTQKVQIAKGAGTLNLRCATGSDVQNGIWDVLGFDASADKTGSLSYAADSVFTSAAEDQVIRSDCWGFKDASGTYTGTANEIIQYPAEIVWFLLREVLNVPASAIDSASFIASRTAQRTTPYRPCSLYIGSPRTVSSVFEELETSGNMDVSLQGGVWYCTMRDDSVPGSTPSLEDADYLSFEAGYNPDDLYGTVGLSYNESPDNPEPIRGGNYPWAPGAFTELGETTDETVALRYNRPESITFKTCLRDKDDATYPLSGSRLEEIAAEAQTKRRRFKFRTKGKALQVPVNGKLQLTRSTGLGTSGTLSSVLVRVLSKRDDWARWVSDVEAIEIV